MSFLFVRLVIIIKFYSNRESLIENAMCDICGVNLFPLLAYCWTCCYEREHFHPIQSLTSLTSKVMSSITKQMA